MGEKKPIRGTREWAVANIDCCIGCSHNCRYCYARYEQVIKRGLFSAQEWRSCQIRHEDVARVWPLYPGQVMFPTTHDILPENLTACITVIRNLIKAGNRVLVVSKPHLQCIKELCRVFAGAREKLLFRFTITGRNSELLSFWEPGAPLYLERRESLRLAYNAGFATSVSVEPMLDSGDVVAMVHELLPWVSHSIWLGKMNKIGKRVVIDGEETRRQVERIVAGQTDEIIQAVYRQLKDQPLVHWKESIKTVIGLPLVQQPGEDK